MAKIEFPNKHTGMVGGVGRWWDLAGGALWLISELKSKRVTLLWPGSCSKASPHWALRRTLTAADLGVMCRCRPGPLGWASRRPIPSHRVNQAGIRVGQSG